MLKMKFDVSGYGWGHFRITNGKKIIQCPASFLFNTPAYLVKSALEIQEQKISSVVIQMELEELHLVLVKRNDKVIDYLITFTTEMTDGYARYKECIIDSELDIELGLDWSQEIWDREIDFVYYYDLREESGVYSDDRPTFEDTTWQIRKRWRLDDEEERIKFEADDPEEYKIFNGIYDDDDEDPDNAGGIPIWVFMKGTCTVDDYVSEVIAIFDKVEKSMGFEKFDKMWELGKFPVELYEKLKIGK